METADIPEIQLKKVGQNRDRKKGGLPLFGGGRAAGGFRGATGGSGAGSTAARSGLRGLLGGGGGVGGGAGGAGGLGGALAAKLGSQVAMRVIMSLVVSSVFGSAWLAGRAMRPPAQKGPRAFSDAAALRARDNQKYEAKNLPGAGGYQSGLALVSGSLGGKTPEEIAAEKAAAEKAAQEAQAGEQAAAPAEAAPEAPVPDPAAMAAAAAPAAGGNGPFGSRFGSLSSSLGGGSGARALAGGAGLSGGSGGRFNTGNLGKGLRGFSRPTADVRRSAAGPRSRSGGPRGLAGRQLNRAFQMSRDARSQQGSNAAYTAGQPFDNSIATDKAIADPTSAPTGGGPTSAGNPSNGGNGGGGGGNTQPNSVGSTTPEYEETDCTKILPETFGESVKGKKFENSPSGGCVLSTSGGPQSASPWTSLAKIGATLLKIAYILLTMAAIFSLIGKATLWAFGAGAAFLKLAMLMAKAAAALSAVAGLIGVAMMGMGNMLGGIVMTMLGGITAAAAWTAATAGTTLDTLSIGRTLGAAAATTGMALLMGPIADASWMKN